jgi:cold shock CspA family protein
LTGRVVAFDGHEGLGEVAADDGTTYPFHCVAIADGTRTITVGTTVSFELAPGLPGRWEATAINAVSRSVPSAN